MRLIPGLVFLSTLVVPSVVNAQSLELFGSAGPTLPDRGDSLAAGAGFSPDWRFSVVVSFERTHLSSRTTVNERGGSIIRGGTLLLGTGEVRFAPLGRERVGPYGVAGLAAGVSRPNVTAADRDRITNQARAAFAGGGLLVPVNDQLTFFVDARMMLGAEGNEGIVAVVPLRAGFSWRF